MPTALDAAKPGPVVEGPVGGGTGMVCNGLKGGIGTASRVITVAGKDYTLGVLVQCNYGGDLQVLGAPVARDHRFAFVHDAAADTAVDGFAQPAMRFKPSRAGGWWRGCRATWPRVRSSW